MSKFERLFGIDALIRSGSYPNVRSLTERFEVSERSIYDDIAYLRERCRAPLEYSRARQGYYYTDPTWPLPNMLVTEGELLAFFLSVELTRRYLGTAFEAPLRKALERLSGTLPDEVQVDLGVLAQHYTFQPGATAGVDPTLLLTLFECVRERWPFDMLYFTASSGERKQRVINPHHLFNVRGDWQVVAFDHLRQQFRQFAVSRIEAWTVLRHERFVRDPDFSVEAYLRTGFLAERGDEAIPIEVWFDPYQARYIRGRTFHESQQVEDHGDGSLTVRFTSGALNEVRRWVMSFGCHARVIAPASLANEVAAELRATLRLYEDG